MCATDRWCVCGSLTAVGLFTGGVCSLFCVCVCRTQLLGDSESRDDPAKIS